MNVPRIKRWLGGEERRADVFSDGVVSQMHLSFPHARKGYYLVVGSRDGDLYLKLSGFQCLELAAGDASHCHYTILDQAQNKQRLLL